MNYVEEFIPLADRAAWEAALAEVPHGFAHTWSCCDAVRATCDYPTFLYVLRCETGIVLCPWAERERDGRLDIVTPYGLSGFAGRGEVPGFLARWQDFCRARGYVCAYVAQNPAIGCALPEAESLVSNTLFVLDLRLPLEALNSRMKGGRRREIRKWKESGREFLRDRARLTDFVVEQHPVVMRRIGARPRAFYTAETLSRLCAAPEIGLVGVEEDGVVVAAHVFAHTPHDSEILFMLSLPAGRRYMPMLTWDVVEQCAAGGAPTLNLGGGLVPDDAIAYAKKLYAPAEFSLRCLKRVFDVDAYRALCLQAGADPDDLAGYFPPYRR